MKKISRFVFFLFTAFLLAWIYVSDEAHAGVSQSSPTVDLCGARLARKIAFREGKFFVIVQNKTSAPLKIWGEQCSWGWSNISLEIRSGEKVLPVQRDEINWKHNAPQPVQLDPGDTIVREIRFEDRTWQWDKVTEFCKQNSNAKIFAKLQIDTDSMAKADNIWTGSVRSARSCDLEI